MKAGNTDKSVSFTIGTMTSPITTAGGVYRLCWCRPRGAAGSSGFIYHGRYTTCSLWEDFETDFGAMTLLGPAPYRRRVPASLERFVALDTSRGQASPQEMLFRSWTRAARKEMLSIVFHVRVDPSQLLRASSCYDGLSVEHPNRL